MKMKKIISSLLVTVLTITLFSFTTQSETIASESQTTQNNSVFVDNTLDLSDLPDIITKEEQESAKYIDRASSYETGLNMLVFKSADGTHTKKVYSYPVKYVDDSGQIRDISTDIEEMSDGSYQTAANNIITKFKKFLSEGITLSHKDIEIKMIPTLMTQSSGKETIGTASGVASKTPITATAQSSLSSDNKTVSYPFGENTKLEYSLTYTGFKEDIVVEKYTGQTEYAFILHTNGLLLTQIDGSYFLTDDSGNIKATIGDIIIFTADEKNNTLGSMTHKTITAGSEYLMIIHVDGDYLRDEKTAYPIRIDPTIEINYDISGAGAIEDVTLNSTAGSSGSSVSMYVGLRETYGISRTLMRFPGLNLNDVYSSSNIISATLTVRDLLCESQEMDISAHVFTGNTWTEATANWSNTNPNSYVSTPLSTVTMSWGIGKDFDNPHFYTFDITEAVRGWKAGTYSQDKGIILKMSSAIENGTTYMNRTLGSYNRAGNKPVLSMLYNPKISISYSAASVDEGTSLQYYATTYPDNSVVTWTSGNTTVATVNSSGYVTAHNAGQTTITASITDITGTYYATSIIYSKIPNGVYEFRNMYSDSSMEVRNNSVESFTDVIQRYYSGATYLNELWKIYYVGNGQYTIRPMHCLTMLLDSHNIYGVTVHNTGVISNNVSAIPNEEIWIMERTSIGMKVISATSQGLLSIGSETTASVSLIVESDTDKTYQRWNLVRITENLSGARLYDLRTGYYHTAYYSPITRYTAPGEIRTISDIDLLPMAYSSTNNVQSFQWKSTDTNIATVDSVTGTVTGVSTGTVRIYSDNYQFAYQLIVTEVYNGTYFIENKETEKAIDIENQVMANGTQTHQWTFHGGNTQRWVIEHYEDGYYTIRSANTSIAPFYYLTVQGNSTAEYAKVVLQYNITDGSLWKITMTENGGYKIIPKTGEANGRVLAVEYISGQAKDVNGRDLEQKTYQDNNSYLDEWILYICEENRYKLLAYRELNENNDVIPRNLYFTKVYADIYSNLDGDILTDFYTSHTKKEMKRLMCDSEIFIIHTHGQKDGFMISGSTLLTMNDINSMNLDDIRLALLLTCSTAEGFSETHITNNNPVNIVEQMVCQGAETVIGFKTITTVGDCNLLAEQLMDRILEKELTVQQAYNEILDDDLDFYLNILDSMEIAGNRNLSLTE